MSIRYQEARCSPTYIYDSLCAVLQIDANGEINDVVHAEASSAELLDLFLPSPAIIRIPVVALDKRPASQSLGYLRDGLSTQRFN